MSSKVNEIIAARFIEALEKGVCPWSPGFQVSLPRNVASGKAYRGINRLMLGMLGGDDFFLTFNQAKTLGGSVSKGSKGFPIVFYTLLEKRDGSGDKVPFMRYTTAFSLNQCEGVSFTRPAAIGAANAPIAACEAIAARAASFGVVIREGGNQPSCDAALTVSIPPLARWESPARYYKTLFHEIGHSLMATTEGKWSTEGFRSDSYAKEELVAEIFASFVLAECGVESAELFDNSVAYLQSWAKRFASDAGLIISAAGKAQKRFDALMGRAPGASVQVEESQD